MKFADKWMAVEKTTLNEVSQTRKTNVICICFYVDISC